METDDVNRTIDDLQKTLRGYYPDRWVLLKFNNNGNVFYKILASWYNGFAQGDSWRLNSGVDRVEKHGNTYLFYGSSGSIYQCNENTYGMSAYTSGILYNLQEKVKHADGVSLELMPEETNFMELTY